MDGDNWLSYVLLIALIIGGGYFAGTEISFATANKIRIKNYAESGDHRAKKATYILNNFDKALTTLLVGNNIVHISCASLATLIAAKLWGAWAVTYSTIVITIVVFLLSEMIPKNYASSHAEQFALYTAGSLCFLMRFLSPITALFTWISRGVSRLFVSKDEPTVTEEELYDIIETIKEEGTLEEDKSDLIHSALEFADITVQDVLTSRVDMVAIDAEMTCEEILEVIKHYKFSRIPVYKETIDDIIGILGIRKFLKNYIKSGNDFHWESLLDEPHFVPKKLRIDTLLKEMSCQKFHMAVVSDDYGGTLGIVTVEDILEELVGEIWDEDDEALEEIRALSPGHFEVRDEQAVSDVLDELDIEYEREEIAHKTMGAWALEHFDYIPSVGSRFSDCGLEVTVSKMDGPRITRLILALPEKGPSSLPEHISPKE